MASEKINNIELAEFIRKACLKAAKEGYNDALMRGLCNEGAMEAAVGAIESLDLEKIVQDLQDY